MSFTREQVEFAGRQQNEAAHDLSKQIRLIAGPGTGKSRAIGERVAWLLRQGVLANHIFAVSFTRAATRDLASNLRSYCRDAGIGGVDKVRVSTLHSLALRALQRGNLLTHYPAHPRVLSDGELESVFDEESALALGTSRPRAEEVRLAFEALWQTGQEQPANYLPPDPPITEQEKMSFLPFHVERTLLYACVLPGEIVQKCLESAKYSGFDPVAALGMQHLIVDEYQDLNPTDIELIDWFAGRGVDVFVAGDDDQSIYSFRFASPEGIQGFLDRHSNATDHHLTACFRCAPTILRSAVNLISTYGGTSRIPKQLDSLLESAVPPVTGYAKAWAFQDDRTEAAAIAQSCRELVEAGVEPDKVFVLIANRRVLLKPLLKALEDAGVPADYPEVGFSDTIAGRFVEALLRIVLDTEDYVAHRVLIGSIKGIGVKTCDGIAKKAITSHLNYRRLFYDPHPKNVFTKREENALNIVSSTCQQLTTWTALDSLKDRVDAIAEMVAVTGSESPSEWKVFAALLPENMTLEELSELLSANTEVERQTVIADVHTRLGIEATVLPSTGRVKFLTMHGAKGLTAHVVFIPGLEQEILPGPRRTPYAGLVLEAARMLYVSITRARVACILSFAAARFMYGERQVHQYSQYIPALKMKFEHRSSSLDPTEAKAIKLQIDHL